MLCRFRVLLRCPSCGRVFCVPELAGSSVVWHQACDCPLERVEAFPESEHADRAWLYYVPGDRLEVRCGAERQ